MILLEMIEELNKLPKSAHSAYIVADNDDIVDVRYEHGIVNIDNDVKSKATIENLQSEVSRLENENDNLKKVLRAIEKLATEREVKDDSSK